MSNLQLSLDQSEARITDLESLLHQSETRINQIGRNNSSKIEELLGKLATAQEENQNLQTRISNLESVDDTKSDVCSQHPSFATPPLLLLPIF